MPAPMTAFKRVVATVWCGADLTEGSPGFENCDDGNSDETDTCRQCQRPRCGDAIVDEGEDCDDGNDEDGDSCTNACTTSSLW